MRVATLRIVAITLALCACTVQAQQPEMSTLTVTVEAQTHVPITGVRIVATALATGARFEATTNANGQAVVYLTQGRYDLKVQAKGFMTWDEKDVEVKTEMYRDVILAVEVPIHYITIEITFIPLEHQVLAAEIPLLPMQLFELTAKPIRHKRHWF